MSNKPIKHSDDVIRALDGYVYAGYEDRDGKPVYEQGTKDECADMVGEIFNEVNYHMMHANASSRVIEKLAKMHHLEFSINEYAEAMEEELQRFAGEYMSRGQKADIEREAEQAKSNYHCAEN